MRDRISVTPTEGEPERREAENVLVLLRPTESLQSGLRKKDGEKRGRDGDDVPT